MGDRTSLGNSKAGFVLGHFAIAHKLTMFCCDCSNTFKLLLARSRCRNTQSSYTGIFQCVRGQRTRHHLTQTFVGRSIQLNVANYRAWCCSALAALLVEYCVGDPKRVDAVASACPRCQISNSSTSLDCAWSCVRFTSLPTPSQFLGRFVC